MIAGAPAALSATNVSISAELRRVLATLREAVPGALLAGGAVRDVLSGRQPVDLDIVTPHDAHAAAESAGRAFGGSVFALDEVRGHYRVTLPGGGPIREIDMSSAPDLEADLRRRDFTVDAMAAAIEADGSIGEVIDPTGGLSDLEAGTLRMVSEANLREDPLRLLRAARLAHELQLEIEPLTQAAIQESAFLLPQAAPERQRDELVRMLASPRAARAVRLLDALTLLQELLPEITAARGVGQPFEHHYWDVFDHSVEAVAALDEMLAQDPPEERWVARTFRNGLADFELDAYLRESIGGSNRLVLLKLAALLHDVAKPETKTQEADGRVRFLGHPERGAETATSICRRLRFGSRETQFVALLVEEHLRPTQLSQGDLPSKRALYRYFRDLGEAAPACLFLSLADAAAARGPRLERERWAGHVRYIAWILEQGSQQDGGVAKPQRLIDGGALMAALDLEPGPLIGRLLDAIDEAHAVGDVTTVEQAITLARGLAGEVVASSGDRAVEAAAPRQPAQPAPSSQAANRQSIDSPAATSETPRALTDAESRLWEALRDNRLGVEFLPQHRIEDSVLDFYCPAANLVVELIGPAHAGSRVRDEARDEALEAMGLQVLRFQSEDVTEHLDRVLRLIRIAVEDAMSEEGEGPNDE